MNPICSALITMEQKTDIFIFGLILLLPLIIRGTQFFSPNSSVQTASGQKEPLSRPKAIYKGLCWYALALSYLMILIAILADIIWLYFMFFVVAISSKIILMILYRNGYFGQEDSQ